jgi:hypothetical protein
MILSNLLMIKIILEMSIYKNLSSYPVSFAVKASGKDFQGRVL